METPELKSIATKAVFALMILDDLLDLVFSPSLLGAVGDAIVISLMISIFGATAAFPALIAAMDIYPSLCKYPLMFASAIVLFFAGRKRSKYTYKFTL